MLMKRPPLVVSRLAGSSAALGAGAATPGAACEFGLCAAAEAATSNAIDSSSQRMDGLAPRFPAAHHRRSGARTEAGLAGQTASARSQSSWAASPKFPERYPAEAAA